MNAIQKWGQRVEDRMSTLDGTLSPATTAAFQPATARQVELLRADLAEAVVDILQAIKSSGGGCELRPQP